MNGRTEIAGEEQTFWTLSTVVVGEEKKGWSGEKTEHMLIFLDRKDF